MGDKLKFVAVILFLLISANPALPITAKIKTADTILTTTFSPQNTVVVSNAYDARFSKDFSVLLKNLRLEWIVLDGVNVPESIKEKNIILVGHPDSKFIGAIIREVLEEKEIEQNLGSEGSYFIFTIESPWAENKRLILCLGTDYIERRNAAEELIRNLIADSPPTSDWIKTTYQVDVNSDMSNYLGKLQYPIGEELSIQELEIDLESKPPKRVSTQQAAEDVERLFYLLSHGYSGYALFNQDRNFELAKAGILEELSSQESWLGYELEVLIHKHLSFIVDCHISIGKQRFENHSDFWYEPDLDFVMKEVGYQFKVNDKPYILKSINGSDPAQFLFASLNKQGEPVYRLGILSKEEPLFFEMNAVNEEMVKHTFELKLTRSDFDSFTQEAYEEDFLGGIPVVRLQSFSDYYSDELNLSVKNAQTYQEAAVMIVDLRGNGGGNEHWPSSWIQKLTGRRPASVFVFSELESKTSMMGRANAFSFWDYHSEDASLFAGDAHSYTMEAESIEKGTRKPNWTDPRYPRIPLIPNDTTVVVVTNDLVASAGEGFVMRMSQAENVWVVGENTMGALTFGNVSLHRLPHSKIDVWLPMNINLFPDQGLREGVGLFPDLWVPAADAVNYSVAAIRLGTITTYKPLPENLPDQAFIPESNLQRHIANIQKEWLVIIIFGAAGIAWAFFMRKKEPLVLSAGVVWFFFSMFYIQNKSNKAAGYGFFVVSIISIIWGGINTLRARRRKSLSS